MTPQEFIAKWQAVSLSERSAWLNPPEWTRTEPLEFPGSIGGPWSRYIDQSTPLAPREGSAGSLARRETANNSRSEMSTLCDRPQIGLVRYPRLVPKDADCAKELKKRTLTNLYNQRPAWLDLAHQQLDVAVFAAYDWPPTLTDDELLAKLLAINLARSAT